MIKEALQREKEVKQQIQALHKEEKELRKIVNKHCDHTDENGESAVTGTPYYMCSYCSEW